MLGHIELEQVLTGTDRRDIVQKAIQFLAGNDLIDEIYCSDGELAELIAKVLQSDMSVSSEEL